MAVALRDMEFPCQPLVSDEDFAGEVQRNCGRDRAQRARGAHFYADPPGLAQKWCAFVAKYRDFARVYIWRATRSARVAACKKGALLLQNATLLRSPGGNEVHEIGRQAVIGLKAELP
jgi:hypothetical protein